MLSVDALSLQMVELARSLHAHDDLAKATADAASRAVALVPGTEAATIELVGRRGRVEQTTGTAPWAADATLLQRELREGPAVTSLSETAVVHGEHVGHDERWPRWGPLAAERYAVGSAVCFRLETDTRTVGVLSLYSRHRIPVDVAGTSGPGQVLAAHLAIGLASVRTVASFLDALERRSLTGQAVGILMQRYVLDADGALAALKRHSMDHNTKLHEVAAQVVATRALPPMTAPREAPADPPSQSARPTGSDGAAPPQPVHEPTAAERDGRPVDGAGQL